MPPLLLLTLVLVQFLAPYQAQLSTCWVNAHRGMGRNGDCLYYSLQVTSTELPVKFTAGADCRVCVRTVGEGERLRRDYSIFVRDPESKQFRWQAVLMTDSAMVLDHLARTSQVFKVPEPSEYFTSLKGIVSGMPPMPESLLWQKILVRDGAHGLNPVDVIDRRVLQPHPQLVYQNPQNAPTIVQLQLWFRGSHPEEPYSPTSTRLTSQDGNWTATSSTCHFFGNERNISRRRLDIPVRFIDSFKPEELKYTKTEHDRVITFSDVFPD